MGKFLVGLVVFLGWSTYARHDYVCRIRSQCESTQQVDANLKNDQSKTTVKSKSLALLSGSDAILSGYDNFTFPKGSFAPLLSESQDNLNNKAFLEKTADYLKSHPDQKVTITGKYLESEANLPAGSFDNIGLARADAIRDILNKEYGLDINQIRLSSNMVKQDGDVVNDALSFDLTALKAAVAEDASKEEIAAVEARDSKMTFDDMKFSDANFEKAKATLKAGQGFKNHAEEVKTFLEGNPDHTILITGFTDSDGKESSNKRLGLRRAEATKRYYRKLGIKVPIKTASKGEEGASGEEASDAVKARERTITIRVIPNN